MADFAETELSPRDDEETVMRGMQAFVKARCNQCHVVAGHGVNLGPDLTESVKKYKGRKLLQQMLEPSSEINEKFLNQQFLLKDGRFVAGVVVQETKREYHVMTNLLTPHSITRIRKKDVDEKIASKVSPMPEGLLNVLTRQEILDLLAFVESGGYKLPPHLQHHHERSSQ